MAAMHGPIRGIRLQAAADRVPSMSRLRMLPAALALMLAGTAGASAAAPAGPTPGVDLVITVRSVQTGSLPSDAPPQGPSKGDRILIRDRLLNVRPQFGRQAGALVGGDSVLVTFTSKLAGRVVGIATLPGGRIRFQGVQRFDRPAARLTVVGGTGRYARVTGFLIVGEGDDPLNIYHLDLASRADEGTTI